MSNLSVFAFDSQAVRVVADDSTGEPLFVGKDLCEALGYTNHNKAMQDHCKGVTKRYPLQTAGGKQEVRVLTEADMFRLIVNSTLPAAERFEAWVFEEVLPSIRRTGSYLSAKQPTPEATAALSFWDAAVKSLNMAPSAHLGGVRAIAANYGYDALLPHLPVYAIDAPTKSDNSAPTSSSPTASITELLKSHGIPVTAREMNRRLVEGGFLMELTRPSSKGGEKRFLSMTIKGEMYGKNVTSPSSPRETQPHWYRETFASLCREVGISIDRI